MIDKLTHITVAENNTEVIYPLAFTFNVLEEIQEEYGSFDAWKEKFDPKDGDIQIKDLKFTVKVMVNEGIDIENDEKGENRPFVTNKKIGRILTEIGMKNMTEQLKDVVTDSISSKN